MTTTASYKLKKPDGNEYVAVDDLNYNADQIDGILKEHENRINCMNEPIAITLTAAGWAGSATPYTQTVAVEGMTAECNPDLVSLLADGASEATQKAYNKAFGLVAAGTGTTGAGTVTFKVYKKPATDIVVGLKGVW